MTAVKRSEKQSASKKICSTHCDLIAQNFGYNCAKCLKFLIFVSEVNFERVWSQLNEKKLFPKTIIHKKIDKISNFYGK